MADDSQPKTESLPLRPVWTKQQIRKSGSSGLISGSLSDCSTPACVGTGSPGAGSASGRQSKKFAGSDSSRLLLGSRDSDDSEAEPLQVPSAQSQNVESDDSDSLLAPLPQMHHLLTKGHVEAVLAAFAEKLLKDVDSLEDSDAKSQLLDTARACSSFEQFVAAFSPVREKREQSSGRLDAVEKAFFTTMVGGQFPDAPVSEVASSSCNTTPSELFRTMPVPAEDASATPAGQSGDETDRGDIVKAYISGNRSLVMAIAHDDTDVLGVVTKGIAQSGLLINEANISMRDFLVRGVFDIVDAEEMLPVHDMDILSRLENDLKKLFASEKDATARRISGVGSRDLRSYRPVAQSDGDLPSIRPDRVERASTPPLPPGRSPKSAFKRSQRHARTTRTKPMTVIGKWQVPGVPVQPSAMTFRWAAMIGFRKNGRKLPKDHASHISVVELRSLARESMAGLGSMLQLSPFDDESSSKKISEREVDEACNDSLKGHGVPALPGTDLNDSVNMDAVRHLAGRGKPRPWDWDYDSIEVHRATSGHSLYLTTMLCLERLHLISSLAVGFNFLSNFLWLAESMYCYPHQAKAVALEDWGPEISVEELPFHSSFHGADVAASTTHLLLCNDLGHRLKPIDAMSMILAAAMHDFRHPGINNTFVTAVENNERLQSLALVYNDVSVLESMHASETFRLMRHKETNFVSQCTEADRKRFRQVIIGCILATDLAKAQEILGTYWQHSTGEELSRSRGEPEGDVIPALGTEAERLVLSQVVVKFADISHGTKKWDLHYAWAQRIQQEFFAQAEVERQLGMQPLPLGRTQEIVPKQQLGFMDFCLKPAVAPLISICNASGLGRKLQSQMSENVAVWKLRDKEEERLQRSSK
eukprot:TRINITY_DN40956_c0_g1_i1.p1 TRINITY_DN40956_c0_g1~~TRINITY_DN40956_c0_g1_i1.p1  ORF type:complete len:884 (-),score=151.92 TRINITY_DN40956_c0_g1_i1:72-2693(-)